MVNVAYYRLPNHDANSGYTQLARYLADKVTVRHVEPARVPEALARRLVPTAGTSFYEPAGVRLEAAVARRLVARPDELCHLFYGEDHFGHLARLRHLPVRRGALVATFHQPPSVTRDVLRERDLRERLDTLDAAIALSREQSEWLAERMPAERVHLVGSGINAFHFRPPESPPPEAPVRCLAVGAWLRDFGVLRDTIERTRGEVEYEVIAPPAAGAELPGTRVRSGLTSAELLAAYQSAHVFVLPVRDATRSNALGEALACGLPVVATGIGAIPDAVGAAGILTAPGDSAAMADAVLALARDPERRRALGALARERALAMDWPHVAHSTVQVYAEALTRSSGTAGRRRLPARRAVR